MKIIQQINIFKLRIIINIIKFNIILNYKFILKLYSSKEKSQYLEMSRGFNYNEEQESLFDKDNNISKPKKITYSIIEKIKIIDEAIEKYYIRKTRENFF